MARVFLSEQLRELNSRFERSCCDFARKIDAKLAAVEGITHEG
jgi:hypothetical protein